MNENSDNIEIILDWNNFLLCLNVLLEDYYCRNLLKCLLKQRDIHDKYWLFLKLSEIEKELKDRKQ